MAEGVEPPTVAVRVTFQRQLVWPTIPGAQGRQRLAAILPELFDVAIYRDCWPNLMVHKGLLELLGEPRAELCAFPSGRHITYHFHSATPPLRRRTAYAPQLSL